MEVRFEDVDYKLQALVDIVGMEKFVEISRLYGGDRIYIPTYGRVVRLARNRAIVKEYNGFNTRELAIKYRVSANHVSRIVGEKNSRR